MDFSIVAVMKQWQTTQIRAYEYKSYDWSLSWPLKRTLYYFHTAEFLGNSSIDYMGECVNWFDGAIKMEQRSNPRWSEIDFMVLTIKWW